MEHNVPWGDGDAFEANLRFAPLEKLELCLIMGLQSIDMGTVKSHPCPVIET